jgi:mRNA-degrading endonuclease toxin of MazEF toxin-antitoxin module
LIISGDEYNDHLDAMPWAIAVERDAPRIPGYLVRLAATDPLPGATAVIPRVLRCDTTALRTCLGFLTEETMNAVERGLREFLALP